MVFWFITILVSLAAFGFGLLDSFYNGRLAIEWAKTEIERIERESIIRELGRH